MSVCGSLRFWYVSTDSGPVQASGKMLVAKVPMFHLRSDVSIQNRTTFTQQDPSLMMMRSVASTAQSRKKLRKWELVFCELKCNQHAIGQIFLDRLAVYPVCTENNYAPISLYVKVDIDMYWRGPRARTDIVYWNESCTLYHEFMYRNKFATTTIYWCGPKLLEDIKCMKSKKTNSGKMLLIWQWIDDNYA